MKLPHTLLTFIITILLVACSVAPAAKTNEPLAFKNTAVSLTFDDGDADNYQVRSILAQNNLRATFYVVSGFTGTAGYMTADQLRGLYEDGNEIGGHTLSHTKLSTAHGADLKREICQDRLNLLAYNFNVTSFAYPYGYYDAEAKQMAVECGYNSARIVSNGPALIPPVDAYAIPAMPYVVKDTRFAKMTRYVTEVENAGGGWSIFVFHHICDQCDQYAVSLDTFSKFAQWLGAQQKNGLIVKTMGEAIGGEVKPGVAP